jgi:hypothetical protein
MTLVKILIVCVFILLFVLLFFRKYIEKFRGSTFVIQTFPIGDVNKWCGTAFPNNYFRVLLGIDAYAPVGQQYTPYYFCEVRVPANIDQKTPIDWKNVPKFCMPKFRPSDMGSRYNPGKWAPNINSFFANLSKGIIKAIMEKKAPLAAALNPAVYVSEIKKIEDGRKSTESEIIIGNAVDAISQTEGDSYSYFYRCDPSAINKADVKVSASIKLNDDTIRVSSPNNLSN